MFVSGYSLFRTAGADDFLRGLGLGLAGMVVATVVANAFGDRWTYIEETGFMWAIAAMAIRAKMLIDEENVQKEQQTLLGFQAFRRNRKQYGSWP